MYSVKSPSEITDPVTLTVTVGVEVLAKSLIFRPAKYELLIYGAVAANPAKYELFG
jgi:hypothetical protein